MRKNKILKNVFIIILLSWIVILIKQQINISNYKKDLKNSSSPDYIEKLAREKLGMYLENEKVYIDCNK